MSDKQVHEIVFSVCFFILALTAAQAFGRGNATLAVTPEQPCRGEPIFVEYDFEGGFLEPHACAIQCEDQQERFIYYRNGKATQCEKLPGCRDIGEDREITCTPPAMSTFDTSSL
ncbi:MAG TPA: hypothetical protein VI913_01225 [Candidatus Peribacteraceae bacterium]|nr:hypothetical protein [Candidatus Peribacteraceae bacterium]